MVAIVVVVGSLEVVVVEIGRLRVFVAKLVGELGCDEVGEVHPRILIRGSEDRSGSVRAR